MLLGGGGGVLAGNYPSDHFFLETRFPGFLDADHNDTSSLSSPLCDCSEAFVVVVVVVVVVAAIAVHQSLLSRFNVQFLAKSEQSIQDQQKNTKQRTQLPRYFRLKIYAPSTDSTRVLSMELTPLSYLLKRNHPGPSL